MKDEEIKTLLTAAKTIAIVGLSDSPGRPSQRVGLYLQAHGYKIVPINPLYTEILGEKCFPSLVDARDALSPTPIDIVDIFRKSEDVPPHVTEAIQIKAPVVWMQEGIENEAAKQQAQAAGIKVLMNRCIMQEHVRLLL